MSLNKNTLLNLFGQLVPLGLAIGTVPAYLIAIGEARFGMLSLLWLFAATMALFDFGMGQALTQRLASGTQRSSRDQAGLVVVALLLAGGVGLVGAAIAVHVAYAYVGSVASIAPWLRHEVEAAIPWAAATIPFATVSSVMLGGLQARRRFLSFNFVSVLLGSLATLLPLLFATFFSESLWLLAAAVLVARLVAFVVLCWRTHVEFFLGVIARPRRSHFWQLVSFGRWAFISACVGPFMVISDRFLIGSLYGAVMVSRYTVPFQIAERVTTLSAAIAPALFPRLAAMRKESTQRMVCVDGVCAIAVLTAPAVACSIALVEGFFTLWISENFASDAAPVGRLLLVGFWVNSLALIVHITLLSRGRSDLIAKCHLAEVIPYAILLYIGISVWGVVGAAIVFSFRVVADFALLSLLVGVWRDCVVRVGPPLALMLVQCLAASRVDLPHLANFFVDGIAVVAVACWSIANRSALHRFWRLASNREELK